jgi:copper(I)-binding protein
MLKALMAAALVSLALWSATAEAIGAGSIAVEHAWARATPNGAQTGVAYLTLVNTGTQSDRLIAAASPVAESIQIHEMQIENGIARMRGLEAVDLPGGTTVVLKPSGLHLMLHIKGPLQEGQTFPLTLTFEKAPATDVVVRVRKVGAMDDGGE